LIDGERGKRNEEEDGGESYSAGVGGNLVSSPKTTKDVLSQRIGFLEKGNSLKKTSEGLWP